MQDHSQTKERILRFLRTHGPSLPVHISKEINQSILFTSAFLSELLSEKRLKMSNMRVGSSPIYFLPGQEPQLEKYSDNIRGKEKEALLLLKEKQFLNDEAQHPAIRVALRSIKDFAIPFQKNNHLFWRYFIIPEAEFEKEEETEKEPPTDKSESEKRSDSSLLHSGEAGRGERLRGSENPQISSENKGELNVFDNSGKTEKKVKKEKLKAKKKTAKKKSPPKTNEKFFNRVKEFLKEKQIEIVEIEGIEKNELIFRVEKDQKEQFLFAYNKKQIKEDELVRANKRAAEANMKYTILCLGEQTRKLSNFIDAVKNLETIEKID